MLHFECCGVNYMNYVDVDSSLIWNSDEYIDVNSNEVHSTDDDTGGVKLNGDEDDNYSVSSGSESSNDSDDADKGNDDKPVEVDVVVGDRVVSINSIASEEIRAIYGIWYC
jgi:hypothetical protein